MNKDLFLKLLRQVLTYGGTALTSAGVASSEEVATGAGALVTLLGVVWTIWSRQRAKSAAAAQAAAQADPAHHTIGMPPGNLLILFFLVPTMMCLLPGCTSVT